MRRAPATWLMVLMVSMSAAPASAANGNVDLPRYPSISPDGREIVFSWRGDLWKVGSSGGHALRLTAHPADDTRSAWSRDGKRIAFESNRTGDRNLFIMNADGTGVRQVLRLDRPVSLTGFGTDDAGREVLFFEGSIEGDVYRAPRPYMVPTEGGALRRVHDAFGAEPSQSADGSTVAFTRGGSAWSRRGYRGPDNRNVWTFNRSNGAFTQLTTYDGNDGKALWGAGRTIYFLSDRDFGCVNLFRMSADDGERALARATSFQDRDIWDYDVAADGATAVLVAWDTLYTLDLRNQNAEPRPLTITAGEDESDNIQLLTVDRRVSEAALSPDGKVMAVVAYGEVYVRNVESGSPTRRVTASHAREKDIAWSPDGSRLYFVSDSDGTESIYAATVAVTRGEIKAPFDEAARPRPAAPVEESKPAADPPSEGAAAGQGEQAGQEEPRKEEPKKEEPKKPDPATRWHDAVTFTIEPVVVTSAHDRAPRPSPDGRWLSFRRGRGDIVIRDLTTGDERTFLTGWDFSIDWRWTDDSRHILYSVNDRNFNADVWLAPADGSSPPVNLSRHPDNDEQPRLSADGKVLAFVSERLNEEYDVWMVFLDRNLEAMAPVDREKYFKEAIDAAKKRKPLAISDKPADPPAGRTYDTDDAYLRLRRASNIGGSERNLEITPAGDRLVFTSSGETSGLFSIKWDGSDQKRLHSSVSVQHLTVTGDKVVFVDGGRAGMVPVNGGSVEYIDISDRMRIDLQQQADQKFREAARILGEVFYHPTMKDLDWEGLTTKYLALARQSRTADEFNYVAAYLLGELNGSHLGVNSPGTPSPIREAQGRLGVRYEVVDNGFRVTHVIPRSPAAEGPMALRIGDIITGIDFEPVAPLDTLEARLTGRVGQETAIDVSRTGEDGAATNLRLLLTPVSAGAEVDLQYDAWQRRNQQLVHEWSGGKLGYLHIRGMNAPSLNEFERDLYAAAEGRLGLIIDVRNNGGGSTADLVLSSIMVQPHAYTVPRGADSSVTDGYPQDRLYIQRYIRPVNMMCNEKSFSNAEIVSHAFKTLKRGTLVGQQTYGGVISTGAASLIDGTSVRTPFRGWYLPDGTDMENNGAMPDIVIHQTPEDESRDHDAQLKACVEDLLKRVQ